MASVANALCRIKQDPLQFIDRVWPFFVEADMNGAAPPLTARRPTWIATH